MTMSHGKWGNWKLQILLICPNYLSSTFFYNSRGLTPHILQFKGAFSPSSTNSKGYPLKKLKNKNWEGQPQQLVSYTTVHPYTCMYTHTQDTVKTS